MDVPRESDWSKLCPDVLCKILESLTSPLDCHRAKTVCSNWYAVWKTCFNKPPCPWLIIHKGNSSTRSQNDKGKIVELSTESYCMASSGNWLLMVDPGLKFYILNLTTRARINLISMTMWRIRGGVKFRWRTPDFAMIPRWSYGYFIGPSGKENVSYDNDELKNSIAVLWINEVTGDYVVAWTFRQCYLFSTKKGDDSWCNLNLKGKSVSLFDMACENNKLYVFTNDLYIKVYDFSTRCFIKTIYLNHHFNYVEEKSEYIWKRKIAIQRSGEVLIILSLKEVLCDHEDKLLFYIFKMNLLSGRWERVYSIGDDEMLIFGHGVTVTPVSNHLCDGFKSGSICFVDDDVWKDHHHQEDRGSNCGVFDIATNRIEWPKKICFDINYTQWFVPGAAYREGS